MAETRTEFAQNSQDKLEAISTLAAGTDYSLSQITNPPVQVKTAMDFNTRILTITGNPNLDDLQKIKEITDLLNSEIERAAIT